MGGQWYRLTVQKVLQVTGTDLQKGLNDKQVAERTVKFRPQANKVSLRPLDIFKRQLKNSWVLLVILGSVLAALTGSYSDGVVLLSILLINVVCGFISQYRVQKTIDLSTHLSSSQGRVIREGIERTIFADQILPGDLVILEPGQLVPADLRLVEADFLEIDEWILSGNKKPVKKNIEAVNDVSSNSASKNMAYLGTTVITGRGRGIAVATGLSAELGHVWMINSKDKIQLSHWERELTLKTSYIAVLGAVLSFILIITGVFKVDSLNQSLLLGIALSAAFIPFGLAPAVITSLATSIQRLMKNGAIVKGLKAMEQVSEVDCICSGKTGFFTEGKMVARKIITGDIEANIHGEGFVPKGEIEILRGDGRTTLNLLFKCATLCNNSSLFRGGLKIGGMFRGIITGKMSAGNGK